MPDYLSTDPYAGVYEDAEAKAGLRPGLLSAIAQQENVNPLHNNPLGLSTDSGVMTFAPEEASQRIYRQAALMKDPSGPYSQFAKTGDIGALAQVYSPQGAGNDINGTNSTEASGIQSALNKRYISTDPSAGLAAPQAPAATSPVAATAPQSDDEALDAKFFPPPPKQATPAPAAEPWYAKYIGAIGQSPQQADSADAKIAEPVIAQHTPAMSDVLDAIDPAGVIRSRLTGPTDFPLPQAFEPNKADSFPVAAAKGAANIPSELWNFVTSPGGAAASAGIGALPVAGRSLVGMGFGAQMGGGALEDLQAGRKQEAIEKAMMAFMASKGASHELGAEPAKPTMREVAPPLPKDEALPANPEMGDLQTKPAPAIVPPPNEQAGAINRAQATTLRPGDEQVGQQPPSDAGTPGVARPGTSAVGAPERPGSGTSNRAFEETHGTDVIPSGEGVDTTELLDNARASIRSGAVNPYSVLSGTRDRGIANPEEYAALAAEHERLVNDAVAKQKANDPLADKAVQEAEDFANAIQPHKTAASDLFRLFQGDVNYDLSAPFGIDQYMKAELGRGMKPVEAPKFNRMAEGIRRGETDVAAAVERADVKVRNRYAKVVDIPIEEAVARVKAALKPCQVG